MQGKPDDAPDASILFGQTLQVSSVEPVGASIVVFERTGDGLLVVADRQTQPLESLVDPEEPARAREFGRAGERERRKIVLTGHQVPFSGGRLFPPS